MGLASRLFAWLNGILSLTVQRAAYRCEVETSPRSLEREDALLLHEAPPSQCAFSDWHARVCRLMSSRPVLSDDTLDIAGRGAVSPVINGADQRRQVCSQIADPLPHCQDKKRVSAIIAALSDTGVQFCQTTPPYCARA